MTYKPCRGGPPPIPQLFLDQPPSLEGPKSSPMVLLGPKKIDQIEVQRSLATKTLFSGRDLPSCRLDVPLKSVLAPAPFWLGSTDAREHERH